MAIISLRNAALLFIFVFANYFYIYSRSFVESKLDTSGGVNLINGKVSRLNSESNLTKVQEYKDDASQKAKKTFSNPKILQKKAYPKLQYIMLVSSLGRSGSSWVGELIFQIGNAFYVTEPDHFFENVSQKDVNSPIGAEFLKRQFLCDIDEGFLEWVRNMSTVEPFTIFKSSFTEMCRKKTECIRKPKIDDSCQRSTVKMFKTIRVHLETLLQLLTDPDMENLKIVYLIRDPRAAMNSRKNLGWNADPQTKCQIVNEDLKWYRKIRQDFPDNIYLLRYETLSTDTENEATRLWQFLTSDPDSTLNPNWSSFLETSSKVNLWRFWKYWDSFSLVRNTKQEWVLWRTEFQDETYLREIEKHCDTSLSAFGFNKFGSIEAMRDLRIPSLRSKEECPQLPC